MARKDASNANALVRKYEAQIADAKARANGAVAKVAEADARSAEASAKAESFRFSIARANESARKAEAQAAQSALELARFRAPRTLSSEQQATIASHLRPFGKMRVDVIIIGDASDIVGITQLIIAAIQQAGWTVNVAGKAISGPNVSGVLIGTHIGSDRKVIEAAEALIAALQSSGIVSGKFVPQFDDKIPMAIMGNGWDEKKVAPIRMLVSAKP